MELSRDKIKEIINDDWLLMDDCEGNKNCDVVKELARIALASLEADAVAYVDPFAFHNFSVYRAGETDNKRMGREWMWANPDAGLIPVYTAPPAPVSVPTFDEWLEIRGNKPLGWVKDAMRESYDACRAAMLHGAEPVTTAYKLPANTPCKDAPEHIWLQTAGVWPENGEFSELTWCSDNQHPDDTLYVRADVVAGNSPVIPDGWALVPIEPTEHMIVEGFESEPDEFFSDEEVWEAYDAMSGCQQAAHRAKLCWAAMIAAAPQQEAKNG